MSARGNFHWSVLLKRFKGWGIVKGVGFSTRLNAGVVLASLFLWPIVSEGATTYSGTNGVRANLLTSNSVSACTGCHYDGGSGPDFTTDYSAFSTYATDYYSGSKTSAAQAMIDRTSLETSDPSFMPQGGGSQISSGEMTLLSNWKSNSAVDTDNPSVSTTSGVTGSGKDFKTSSNSAKFTVYANVDDSGVDATSYDFDYGTSQSADGTSSSQTVSGSGGGTSTSQISQEITDLECGTLYYFRVVANNSTYNDTSGGWQSATTDDCNGPPVIAAFSAGSATEDVEYQLDINATDPESDSITYSLSNAPSGMSINSSSGLISWTPENGVSTSGTVTITASDDQQDGATPDTETFSVSVSAVNDAPQITSSAGTSATESVQYSYQLSVTDVDNSSGQLNYALSNAPSGMSISSSGLITWTPDNGVSSSGTVTVTVTDQEPLQDSENFSISVTAVNTGPTITSTAGTSATEDIEYTYTLSISDDDDSNNGTDITFALSDAPSGMVVSSTGVITWTPAEGQADVSSITITVSDGGEDSAAADSEVFSISVTAVNDAPSITSTAGTSATEDVQYSYQLSVSDPDDSGSNLSYSLSNAPDGMAVSSSGLISWTPDNDDSSSGEVTVSVSDGGEDGAVAATEDFTISVTAVNGAPSITSTAGTSATEDVLYQYTLSISDEDDSNNGTDLTFSLSNAPSGMSVSSTGVITWTPSEGQGNASSIQITVSDGGEDSVASASETFSITVTAVNDGPAITSTAVTTATESVAYSYQVSVSDDDDSSFSYSLSNAPSGMSISSSGLISWTPANDVSTSGSVTVSVSDGGEDGAAAATEIFTISVTAVNTGPTITSTATTSATEDVQYQYTLSVSDDDDSNNGTDLTFALTNAPSGMSVSSTGVISWTPEEAQANVSNIVITVSDGGEDSATSDSETFSITVTAVNDGPDITSSAGISAIEDIEYTYQVEVTDPDDSGTDLSYALSNAPSGMTVSTSGLISWTPTSSDSSSGEVTLTVSDGGEDGATSDTETFTINVIAVNTGPSITSTAPTTATEGVQYQYTLSVTDLDDANNGVDLSYSLSNAPDGMTISSTGVITWTPTQSQTQANNIVVSVADGGENGVSDDSETFSITVTAVNDAPQITSTAATTAVESVEYNYQLAVSDEDDTSFSYALSNAPSGMSISDSGLISWIPENGVTTSGTVTVSVSDGGEDGVASASEQFTIIVTPVNTGPSITSSTVTQASEDILYSYTLSITDEDDDNNGTDLTFSLSNAPSGMSVSSTGVIQWTPGEGVTSAQDIVITVSDGGEDGAASASQTFTITVTAVNDAPSITSTPSTSAVEGVSYSYQVSVSDVDDSGDELSYALSNAPSDMTISNSGLISWTPANGDSSSGEITLTVSDGGEDSAAAATQTFTISVTAVNTAPTITSTAVTVATENTLYQYTLVVSDDDDENNGVDLSFVLTNAPTDMTISETGLIEWTPEEGVTSAEDIEISVSDGGEDDTSSDSQTFSITVTAVNDGPQITSTPSTSVVEGVEYTYQVTVSDVDDSEFTYALLNAPSDMNISDSGFINWTPQNAVSNSGSFTVQVSDGGEDDAAPATQVILISVVAFNTSPTISSAANTRASEDVLYQYALGVNDEDDANNGVDLTFTLDDAPDGMTVSDLGVIEWTPVEGVLAANNISITVWDGGEDNAQNDTQVFSITVAAVNDSPQLSTPNNHQMTELESFSLDMNNYFSDIDDDNNASDLTWSLNSPPSDMVIDSLGNISWLAGENSAGLHIIEVQLNDGGEDNSQAATSQFNLTVLLLDADLDMFADYADNCPQTFNDSQLDTDEDGQGNECDEDDDNDGLPDSIEIEYQLNPLDATDAIADLDGDGLTNIIEFESCVAQESNLCAAIITDSVAPTITTSGEQIIQATGYLTPAILQATAVDETDGELVPVADELGPFRPGLHTITWQVSDAAGNNASMTQKLQVLPQVRFIGSLLVGEAQSVSLIVGLSGDAPSYPVLLNYEVAGTSDETDHNLIAGQIEITGGQQGQINFEIVSDDILEEDESILISITTVSDNVYLASEQNYEVSIVDRNVAPTLTLALNQNSTETAVVYQDQGPFNIIGQAFDANNDEILWDWSLSDERLDLEAQNESSDKHEFELDPSVLDTGYYLLEAQINDGQLFVKQQLAFVLKAIAPILDESDTDGDGVSDINEGLADTDGDGILDYRDPVDDAQFMHKSLESSDTSNLMQAQQGYRLKVGQWAIKNERDGAQVSSQDLSPLADDNTEVLLSGEILDFEVSGTTEINPLASVVIPLTSPIAIGAQYWKFDGENWYPFDDSGQDYVASARRVDGVCPQASSDLYSVGLTAFDDCILLVLEDGGANDTDGELNGTVRDPGGLVMPKDVTRPPDQKTLQVPDESPGGSGALNFKFILFLLVCLFVKRRGGKACRCYFNGTPCILPWRLNFGIPASNTPKITQSDLSKVKPVSMIDKSLVFLSLILISSLAIAELNWLSGTDITVATDSNLSQAEDGQNIISDRFSRIDARLGFKKELAFNKAVIVEGMASYQAYEFTQKLNRSELSGRLIYRWQQRFSYRAPWYQIMLDGQRWDVAVDQRDSDIVTLQIMASARLTTHVSWVLGLENKQRDSEGSVFDTKQNRAFLHFDYTVRGWPAVYGGVAFIDGDIISTAQASYCNGLQAVATYGLIVDSAAIEWDQAFSEDYCGNWISYQLKAQTYTGTLGINWAINHSTALDMSFLYADVSADGDNEYQRQVFQINILKAF